MSVFENKWEGRRGCLASRSSFHPRWDRSEYYRETPGVNRGRAEAEPRANDDAAGMPNRSLDYVTDELCPIIFGGSSGSTTSFSAMRQKPVSAMTFLYNFEKMGMSKLEAGENEDLGDNLYNFRKSGASEKSGAESSFASPKFNGIDALIIGRTK
ncbi:hypothetical protein B0O99DRAFT_601857 [Bisporella sp. PMI_857]|nr:hypothetical protein B0O99DRAFT_601857 [Bisporella sp. PMI_857]